MATDAVPPPKAISTDAGGERDREAGGEHDAGEREASGRARGRGDQRPGASGDGDHVGESSSGEASVAAARTTVRVRTPAASDPLVTETFACRASPPAVSVALITRMVRTEALALAETVPLSTTPGTCRATSPVRSRLTRTPARRTRWAVARGDREQAAADVEGGVGDGDRRGRGRDSADEGRGGLDAEVAREPLAEDVDDQAGAGEPDVRRAGRRVDGEAQGARDERRRAP